MLIFLVSISKGMGTAPCLLNNGINLYWTLSSARVTVRRSESIQKQDKNNLNVVIFVIIFKKCIFFKYFFSL